MTPSSKLADLKKSLLQQWHEAVWGVFSLLSAALFFYALAIVGHQIYFWLKYDDWVAVRAIYLFIPTTTTIGDITTPTALVPDWFQGSWPWLVSPNSWFGLHKIVFGVLDF